VVSQFRVLRKVAKGRAVRAIVQMAACTKNSQVSLLL